MRSEEKGTGRRPRKAMILVSGLVLLAAILLPAVPAMAQPKPQINNVLPTRGPVGTPVTIAGNNFLDQGPFSKVTFNGTTAQVVVWRASVIEVLVPAGAASGPVVVTTASGDSNGVSFEVVYNPAPTSVWYLAEGSTAYGFDTYIMLQNTTPNDATVRVSYNTNLGNVPRPQAVGVPASSRVTLHVNDELPGLDFSTTLQSSQPIVVERAMYWNNRIEGTESIGVTQPGKTWYLAEGYTDGGYQTYVLVQNPGTTGANVNVTYMTSRGVVKKQPFWLAAGRRFTIDVNKDCPTSEVSTQVDADLDVICERSMYWDNKRGGHDTIGVTKGSKAWYLAEGSTAWGYKTYLLIQNPGAKWATVDVTYNTAAGPQIKPTFMMEPQSRFTIFVNNDVINNDTSIKVASDQELIAERSMYWDNGTGKAGHETVGVPAPSTSVFLAEGSTAWGFDTYICIQNPNDRKVAVTLTFMTNKGMAAGPTLYIDAGSRTTAHLNEMIPNTDVSTKVQCDLPIMAERAMYWNSKGGGHSSIGWSQ